MNVPLISIADALVALLRHPVVVIGPAATSYLAINSDILARLRTRWPHILADQSIDDFRVAVDHIKTESPDDLPLVREIVYEYLRALPPTANIQHLVSAKWSAVVSLALDNAFESALRSECDRVASSFTVTIIDHPSITPPPHTIPVYKLFGNLEDHRPGHSLALGVSDCLKRKQLWQAMLQTLTEYCRNAPLFFVGTDTVISETRDSSSAVYAGKPPFPRRLLFLKGDGTLRDATFNALAVDNSEVALVDGSLKEFCEATVSVSKPPTLGGYITAPRVSEDAIPYSAAFAELGHLVDVVPRSLPKEFDRASHRRRLLDGLFRPTSLDWLPFLCGLGLARTDTEKVAAEIALKTEYLPEQAQPLILLRGEAGVGKSTVLKQLATRFAQGGYLVLWCKQPPHGLQRGSFLDVGKRVSHLQRGEDAPKVLVICDDPFALRIQPHHLVDVFEQAQASAVFLIAARNSDVLAEETVGITLPVKPDASVELAHELDHRELTDLRDFLVQVGVTDAAGAQRQVESVPTTDATDVLCSLWYLLPETRSQLSASLQDEYCRLGGASGAIAAYANDMSALGDRARLAYESVAVTSNLGMGLPLEVLIRTVGLSYDEWTSMCVGGKPAWGLVYDAVDPETDNIVFTTRNHIVTKVLLELVNGGTGHAGEFRVLKELVSACNSATLPYRTFLVDLLVKRRKRLEHILSYHWGSELYELALSTFPLPDRTLEHHFGTWQRQAGRNPQEAYKQYEKALNVPTYPYATREERKEHIHTSMAAAVVDMVRQGTQVRENALELVEEHLRHATRANHLDPHTDHVFANLLFQLSRIESPTDHDAVSLRSVAEALRTIEHSLQFIGATGRKRRHYLQEIKALHELQTNIIRVVGIDDAKRYAAECFQSGGNQSGFEVVGRCLLQKAQVKNIGSDYKEAYDYLSGAMVDVESAGQAVAIDLRATRLDCLIRWRIQQARGPIEWVQFRDDLAHVVNDRKYQDDVVKSYYYALALFHLGEYTKGQAVFESIKRQNLPNRVRTGMRNCLVGPEGLPLRVQGDVRSAHSKSYVYVPKLELELEIFGPIEAAPGATVNVYVLFSLAGAFAVFERPADQEAVLP